VHINWHAAPFHAAVVALCNAVLQAASSFGAHLTGPQEVSITSLMNALLVLLSVIWVTTDYKGQNGG
jgi:hypothetical protein